MLLRFNIKVVNCACKWYAIFNKIEQIGLDNVKDLVAPEFKETFSAYCEWFQLLIPPITVSVYELDHRDVFRTLKQRKRMTQESYEMLYMFATVVEKLNSGTHPCSEFAFLYKKAQKMFRNAGKPLQRSRRNKASKKELRL